MANNELAAIPLNPPLPDLTEHLFIKEIHDALTLAAEQGGGQIITVD
jgi:hypothetical protein